MSKKADYSKESVEALVKLETKLRKDAHDFRFGVSGAKVKNIKEGRNLRREIARVKTALTKKKNDRE